VSFDLDPNYVGVPERLAELREKHPDASLQPVNLDQPFDIVTVDGKWFVVYAAACYRTPDDPRPGVGVAWEPVPGRTPFTRDSEIQNAETSAWGRAIVAAQAADAKRGVASADEVRNRAVDAVPEPTVDLANLSADDVDNLRPRDLFAALGVQGGNVVEAREQLRAKLAGEPLQEVAGAVDDGGPSGRSKPSQETAPAATSQEGGAPESLGEDPTPPSANRVHNIKVRNRALQAAGVSINPEKKKRGLEGIPEKQTADGLAVWEAMLDDLEAEQARKTAELHAQDERRVGA